MGVIGGTNSIVTDGLVFTMDPFNEQSWTGPNSSTTYNTVGTNTGTIYNDTSGSYGDNNSFEFDGTDDYINCGNDSNLNFSSDVSVSAWVKTTQETAGAILGKAYYRLEFGSNGIVSWAVYRTTSNGRFLYSTTAINDGQWHHIIATHTANGNQLIYVDGQLEGTTTANTSILTSSNSFFIGRRNATHSRIMNGNIAPVQVYNRALSASEVLQNYNALKGRFGL